LLERGDTMRPTLATAADFKRGMRQLASGVNVITVCDGRASDGLTATAVCSLSAEPPHLLVCVNATANAHEPLRRVGAFCLNVLARGQEDIARRFASMDGAGREARFDLGKWFPLATGALALQGALANFDCLVVREIIAATHTVFIGRVIEVRMGGEATPLIYWGGSFDGLGTAGGS
jgi:flavin reductase (DIM6/NTAB) family NADH-FMN oxidoreductase RutF